MRHNKILNIIALVCIVLTIYLGNINYYTFNKKFYLDQFEKHNVYANFVNHQTPINTIDQLLEYFSAGEQELPDIDIFTQKQKEHLLDVKILIQRMQIVFYVSALFAISYVALLFIHNRDKIVPLIKQAAISTLTISIILVVSAFFFDQSFTLFHKLFFPQGNWMFASTSSLIKMFPKELFFDFFKAILVKCFFDGILMLVVALLLKNRQIFCRKTKDI